MNSYHGSDPHIVSNLAAGNIDVTCGGGELGRGFYTGHYLHEAKAWAYHKTRSTAHNVLELAVPDNKVEALNLLFMSFQDAAQNRRWIRQKGETRTKVFGCDMLWAPIVGSARVSGDQFKWESPNSQSLLNGPGVTRSVI